MYKWKQYLIVQLKRVGKALPGICLLTVVLTVGVLFLLKAFAFIEESRAEKQVAQVGIVGDLSDTYLGIGINVIKNMEGIKSLANIQTLSEEEAKEKFEKGEISAYLLVPDGFIDSILTGENKQLTYVTTERAQDIIGVLMNELVDTISKMVTLTQNSIYAMQIYLHQHDKADNIWKAIENLNYAYIGAVLNRMDVFELQELGISNQISFMGHLFTGILLLLMLLWGINCVTLLVRKESSLLKILHTKGLSGSKQVLTEVAAYSLLQCTSLLCVLLCVLLVKSFGDFTIREWDTLKWGQQVAYLFKMIPVVVLISALQAFLYEMVSNVVTGVLVQFLAAVSLGYISGCIYPITFFPEIMQGIGAFMPTGVALRYMQKGLTQQNNLGEFVLIIGYIVLFMWLHTLRRNYRIKNE